MIDYSDFPTPMAQRRLRQEFEESIIDNVCPGFDDCEREYHEKREREGKEADEFICHEEIESSIWLCFSNKCNM